MISLHFRLLRIHFLLVKPCQHKCCQGNYIRHTAIRRRRTEDDHCTIPELQDRDRLCMAVKHETANVWPCGMFSTCVCALLACQKPCVHGYMLRDKSSFNLHTETTAQTQTAQDSTSQQIYWIRGSMTNRGPMQSVPVNKACCTLLNRTSLEQWTEGKARNEQAHKQTKGKWLLCRNLTPQNN